MTYANNDNVAICRPLQSLGLMRIVVCGSMGIRQGLLVDIKNSTSDVPLRHVFVFRRVESDSSRTFQLK
jgi:hypothetical protein